jgi:hypothetical protein
VLHHHIDVVYADRRYWSVDPFGGEIRDGFLYGRGAIDMNLRVLHLALLAIRRARCPQARPDPARHADEEAGGTFGARGWRPPRTGWRRGIRDIGAGLRAPSRRTRPWGHRVSETKGCAPFTARGRRARLAAWRTPPTAHHAGASQAERHSGAARNRSFRALARWQADSARRRRRPRRPRLRARFLADASRRAGADHLRGQHLRGGEAQRDPPGVAGGLPDAGGRPDEIGLGQRVVATPRWGEIPRGPDIAQTRSKAWRDTRRAREA